jgi:uncharacterized protein (TIGR00295 family)
VEDRSAGRGTLEVIPSEEEAMALHRKHQSSEIIIRHCKTVALVSTTLAKGLTNSGRKVDLGIITAAALLHDIGRNRTQTVRHGLEGAEILKSEGVDERVVQAVRCHVGAGLSVEEAKSLGLPEFDFIPRTIEERVVCFADKMVGSDKVMPFAEEVERFIRKKHDVKRLLALKERIEQELGKDPETFILDNIKESH